jgi:hypothetical protein
MLAGGLRKRFWNPTPDTDPEAARLVKKPGCGVMLPIVPGLPHVKPAVPREVAVRLATGVVLVTTSGAVPVETVEVSCPETEREVPVAAPITGVTRVGDVWRTFRPVPVDPAAASVSRTAPFTIPYPATEVGVPETCAQEKGPVAVRNAGAPVTRDHGIELPAFRNWDIKMRAVPPVALSRIP